MRFDELAFKAGVAAAETGRRAERPPFGQVLARRRRRSLIAGWSAGAVLFVVGLSLLWPGGEPSAPVAAAPSTNVPTTTVTSTTTTAPSTTTITTQYVPAALQGGRGECPVTVPGNSVVIPDAVTPEAPPSSYNSVWHGSPQLWTTIRQGGEIWSGLPVASDGTFTQKTFWWSVDITDMTETPQPDIVVTAHLLNAAGSRSFEGGLATSGSRPDLGVFRIIGLQIPQEGCWEITAMLRGATVSYVTWVGSE